jgi:tetratricopeptide (TPR) repeat protein
MHRSKRFAVRALARVSILLLTLVLPVAGWSAGSGGGGFSGGDIGPATSTRKQSPEQVSAGWYKQGVKAKERAWKLEEKAGKATKDAKRDKLLADARKQYQKAADAQATALKANEKNYEAANELGYALRKTGDYRKAIGAYNYALQLKPDFYPAIEYRGEALLLMGFIDEAKDAYMTLFRNDRALADQLMATMEKWHAAQPEGEAKATFSGWLDERRNLARVGSDLSMKNTRTW